MTPGNEISTEEILKAKQFSNFLSAAKDYCNFIETEGSSTGIEFLRAIQVHLLTMYSLAQRLPFVHLQTHEYSEGQIDDKQMKALLRFTSERVPFSYYWVVLNPVDMNNLAETGTGDLIDDLGDIYKDLKRALVIFESDHSGAKANAIWKFRFDFDYHWGEHCIDALSAIHHYLTENK